MTSFPSSHVENLAPHSSDAELIRLRRELAPLEFSRASERLNALLAKIEPVAAHGFAGLCVKARAPDLACKSSGPQADDLFERLTNSMIRDLAAIEARMAACPVELFGREASDIVAASRAPDEAGPPGWNASEDRLVGRLCDLEDAAVSATALSLRGARFQVCAVASLMDEIDDSVFNRRIHRRLRRGLASVLSVLESIAGEREGGRIYYLSQEYDLLAS